MTDRKLLNIERIEFEDGSAGLRIESAWNKRPVSLFAPEEIAELCLRIQVLFPDYFPDVTGASVGFVQAGKVDV